MKKCIFIVFTLLGSALMASLVFLQQDTGDKYYNENNGRIICEELMNAFPHVLGHYSRRPNFTMPYAMSCTWYNEENVIIFIAENDDIVPVMHRSRILPINIFYVWAQLNKVEAIYPIDMLSIFIGGGAARNEWGGIKAGHSEETLQLSHEFLSLIQDESNHVLVESLIYTLRAANQRRSERFTLILLAGDEEVFNESFSFDPSLSIH